MKKQGMKLCLVASLMVAGLQIAHAAGSAAHIDLSGAITTATCTVDTGASDGTNSKAINLGSALPSAFAKESSLIAGLNTLYVVKAQSQKFTVSLKDCGGQTAANGAMQLNVQGNTLPGASSIFSNDPNASAGFALSYLAPGQQTEQVLLPNTPIDMYTYTSAASAVGKADGASIQFTAYMAAPSSNPAASALKSGLDLAVSYK